MLQFYQGAYLLKNEEKNGEAYRKVKFQPEIKQTLNVSLFDHSEKVIFMTVYEKIIICFLKLYLFKSLN